MDEQSKLLVQHMTKSGATVTLSAAPHLEERYGEGVLMALAVPGQQQYAEVYLDEEAIRHLFGDAAWDKDEVQPEWALRMEKNVKEVLARLRRGDRRPGFEDSTAGGTDLVTPTSVRSDA